MNKAEQSYIAVVLGVGMPPRKMYGSEWEEAGSRGEFDRIDPHMRDMWKYRCRVLVEYERLVPGIGSIKGFTAWMALFFQWCEEQREDNETS